MVETHLLALIGDPVAHSLSPAIHSAALSQTGLAGSYETLRTSLDDLDDRLQLLRTSEYTGFNVTMPLKVAAAGACEVLTEAAKRAGSVNTMRARGDGLEGHSTDFVAFQRLFARPEVTSLGAIHILGAGASARAAIAAGVEIPVYVAARRMKAANEVAESFSDVEVVPWGVGVSGSLVVNATPLGMDGESLPPGVVTAAGGLIDLAYGADPTPAVLEAKSRRIVAVDGVEFLVEQAVESFKWWTGRIPSRDRLLKTVRKS